MADSNYITSAPTGQGARIYCNDYYIAILRFSDTYIIDLYSIDNRNWISYQNQSYTGGLISGSNEILYNNIFYITGGYYSSGGTANKNFHDTIMTFDLNTRQWNNNAGIIYHSVYNHGIAENNGQIFLIGGSNNPSNVSNSNYQLSSIQVYNAQTSARYMYPVSLNQKTEVSSGTSLNDKLYIIGGRNGDRQNINDPLFLNSNTIIDTITQSKTNGLAAPFSGSPKPTTFDDNVYVSYGNYIYKYNLDPASWSVYFEDSNGISGISASSNRLYYINSNGFIYFFDVEIIIPEVFITNPNPQSGFINEQVANRFSWVVSDGELPITQTSAQMQWRNGPSGNITTYNIGPDQSYNVPANTFPNTSNLQWRVMATSTFPNVGAISSEWTEWYTLTTIDEAPLKPTNLNPSSGTRDGTKEITFSWRHNSPLSTPQTAYQIRTTYNQGATWNTLAKTTSSSQIYNAPANSIVPTNTTGTVGWQVRTYNSDDIASDWADTVYFGVENAPDPAEWIRIESDTNRPNMYWVSPVQVAFQIQVKQGNNVIYDTGRVYGVDKSYRLTKPIENGGYTFSIRVANTRGLWSEWSDTNVTLYSNLPYIIELWGDNEGNAANLEWGVYPK